MPFCSSSIHSFFFMVLYNEIIFPVLFHISFHGFHFKNRCARVAPQQKLYFFWTVPPVLRFRSICFSNLFDSCNIQYFCCFVNIFSDNFFEFLFLHYQYSKQYSTAISTDFSYSNLKTLSP